MKKRFLIICLFFLSPFLWSQNVELKNVKQFKNDNTSFYIRKEVDAYDDNSGNSMFFDKEGNLYGYNIDQSRIFKFDESFNVIKDAYLNFGPYVVDFSPYEKGFLVSFFTGAAFYYDYDFNLIIRYILMKQLICYFF